MRQNTLQYEMLRYASLNLAGSTLVISRVITKKSRANQHIQSGTDKFFEEVNVALLSSAFLKDSKSKFIIIPLVSFRVHKRQE
mmetsp:Transcript_10383/g.17430  ORF Transcript_10383/g.17430 Transcript_10383/m.17430 type:complete len:83 (+) Transcript_10383:979-1227(+)